MPDAASTTIPTFYQVYFSTLDPAVCICATWMAFFTPEVHANAFVPKSIAPWNPYFDFLLQQLGGALLMLAFIDVVLLRYTKDVKIWKILEAAVLIYDFALLFSNYYALSQQGRLSFGALRWEDWGGIAITGQAVIVRSAFLFGVGLSDEEKVIKKA